uniref:Amidophosphoribosyltransferase n=1 Tax=candidate division CPR3 bacterium TaxID=2268181 RepID=A0A7V3J8U6_UNCC3
MFAPGKDVSRLTYFGIFTLQHRGQESAGIAVSNHKRIASHKDMGLVEQVFDEDILQELTGDIAIGHTRYSTMGSSNLQNCQPIVIESAKGKSLALAFNGNLVNAKELYLKMMKDDFAFIGTSDGEIIARLLGFYLERDYPLIDAIRETMRQIVGAYSVVVLARAKLVAFRDPCGIRPLFLGKLNNGGFVFSSETCAFHAVGAELIREIEPGEIVIIDKDGIHSVVGREAICSALCIFEFIYFARPDSEIYGRCLYTARRHMGEQLAIEYPVSADMVVPIPDTGRPAAIGYAKQSKIPYGEGLIKSRYIARTFIKPEQRQREMGVKLKLTPLRRELEGKHIVLVEDSIVRGTTTKGIVGLVKEFGGAKEVHLRITAPPYRYPCFYGIDTGAKDELIAASRSINEIREYIAADSLGYLSIEGLIKAVALPKEHFCLACFDNNYPIPIEQFEGGKFSIEKIRS